MTNAKQTTCRHCGEVFVATKKLLTRGRYPVYCSDACRSLGRSKSEENRYRKKPTYVSSCGYCGEQFTTKSRGRKFCHARCRKSYQAAIAGELCKFCGAPGANAHDKKYCSAECRKSDESLRRASREDQKNRAEAKFRLLSCCGKCGGAFLKNRHSTPQLCGHCESAGKRMVETTCQRCHSPFTYKRPNSYRMCEPCRVISQRDMKKTAKAKRRALELGNERESFTSQEIYIRDGWQCYLCGRSVQRYTDPDLVGRLPDEATLDHVVPVSKGGGHTRANIRTACRECNTAKSDTMPPREFVEAATNA